MKTDKLFYRLFLSQPSLINELIPQIPADCDFDYSAPVIKDTEFRLDGLLTPISDNPNLPLIFLECQMQRDREFYSRYFAEIFLYLNQYQVQRPWYGLLILQTRNHELGSDIPYQSLLKTQVKQLYLDDLLPVQDLTPNLALLKLMIVKDSEAVNLAQSVLNSTNNETEFRRRLNLIEAILSSKFPHLSTEEILEMLDLKTATMPSEPRLYKEVAKMWQQQGEAEMVIRLLNRRCGTLSTSLAEQVRSLSIPELESLGEALLDFQSIDDLSFWFKNH
jgi:predicted transposase YdaD